MRRTLTLLLATALLAGCGGGTDKGKEFSKDFKPVNDQLLVLGQDVGRAVSTARGRPDAVLATQFAGFAARLREIKAKVAKLDPPDDRKAQTKALSDACDPLIADLQTIATAAREHKAADARAGAASLVRDSQALRTARRALAQATGAKLGS